MMQTASSTEALAATICQVLGPRGSRCERSTSIVASNGRGELASSSPWSGGTSIQPVAAGSEAAGRCVLATVAGVVTTAAGPGATSGAVGTRSADSKSRPNAGRTPSIAKNPSVTSPMATRSGGPIPERIRVPPLCPAMRSKVVFSLR